MDTSAQIGVPAAIVGMGAVTPIGMSTKSFLDNLNLGATGLQQQETAGSTLRYVCPVDLPAHARGHSSRAVSFARLAVTEALEQAARRGVPGSALRDAALIVGTSAGVRTTWDLSGGAIFQPFLEVDGLDLFHGIATELVAEFDVGGPALTVNAACASGSSAAAVAHLLLQAGTVDLAIVCGAEEFTEFSAAGFEMMGAYSAQPCSPFGVSDGLTLGEGAGAVVLCRSGDAPLFGGAIGFITGSALTCDAYHPTAPEPNGEGLARAIDSALQAARRGRDDVAYVNLHGTGTTLNDNAERALVESVFASDVVVNAIKGSIGHSLGAVGVLELIVTVESLRRRVAPPSVNALKVEPRCGGARMSLASPIPVGDGVGVTVNSAFGGHNAALVVERDVDRDHPTTLIESSAAPDIAAVSIGCSGWRGFRSADWHNYSSCRATADIREGNLEVADDEWLVEPPLGLSKVAWRRLDRLTRHSLLAIRDALETNSLPATSLTNWGLLVSTERGPVDSYARLHEAVLTGSRISPALFPRLVITACSGSIAELLGIRGPVLTFTSGSGGTIGALQVSEQLIRCGVPGVILCGADTVSPFLLESGKSRPSVPRWRSIGECAVAVLLKAEPATAGRTLISTSLAVSRPSAPWRPGGDARRRAKVATDLEWKSSQRRFFACSCRNAETALDAWRSLGSSEVSHLDPPHVPSVGAAAPLLGALEGFRSSEPFAVAIEDDLGAVGGFSIGGVGAR